MNARGSPGRLVVERRSQVIVEKDDIAGLRDGNGVPHAFSAVMVSGSSVRSGGDLQKAVSGERSERYPRGDDTAAERVRSVGASVPADPIPTESPREWLRCGAFCSPHGAFHREIAS